MAEATLKGRPLTDWQRDQLDCLDGEALAVYRRNRAAFALHGEALRIAIDDMALRASRIKRMRGAA